MRHHSKVSASIRVHTDQPTGLVHSLRLPMGATRIAAIVLVVAGVLALAYGGFTYTKSTSKADLGPISIEVQD